MTHEFMLCRNQVADFVHWKSVFDSHAGDPRAAGLELRWIRQSLKDPNEVFFLFAVESVERATAFVEDPASAAVGEEAGVIDGEYHFIRNPGPVK